MKKIYRFLSVALLFILLLNISAPAVKALEAPPFDILAEQATISLDMDKATYRLEFAAGSGEISFQIMPATDFHCTVYADPLFLQQVEPTLSGEITLTPAQGQTNLYVHCQSGTKQKKYIVQIWTPQEAIQYTDDKSVATWARPYVDFSNLLGYGILLGDKDGKLRPTDPLNRHEMAVIAARIMALDCSFYPEQDLPFDDTVASWAKKFITAMTKLGVISGSKEGDKLFYNGTNAITREQVAKILVDASLLNEGSQKSAKEIYLQNKASYDKKMKKAGFEDINRISPWAVPYVALAVCDFQFLSGSVDGGKLYLRPKDSITRQEISVMLSKHIGYDIHLLMNHAIDRATEFLNDTDSNKPAYIIEQLHNTLNRAKKILLNPLATTKDKEALYRELRHVNNLFEQPPVIYLSPSNQMSNSYTGVDTNEGAQMQQVAAILGDKLEKMGFTVHIADVKTKLDQRAPEAAELGAEIYVAIHSNATGIGNNGSRQGSIVFHSNNIGSKELAQQIDAQLSRLTPTKDKGIINDSNAQSPYKEIHLPKMANVLVEVEFHDYPPYAQWIVDNKENIASAFATAIYQYFSL